MPPRKKKDAAPASPALDGLHIAISGSIPRRTQPTIEKNFIVPLGAVLDKSVSDSTTHLVSSTADFNKPSTKVIAARTKGIPIVTFEWLEDCLDRQKHMNEKAYTLPQNDTASATTTDNADGIDVSIRTRGTRKRQAPETGGGDTQPPQAKKGKGKATPEIDEPEEQEPKVAEAQIAKSLDVKIPLDEVADQQYYNYDVYIDGSGIIYDASLNQTNAKNNNNKFYRVQLLRSATGDYKTWTRWGRVGERGQYSALGSGSLDDALKVFREKFKSKSGLAWEDRGEQPKPGKYAFIEKSYEPDSEEENDADEAETKVKKEDEPESRLPRPVQDLMQLIFNQEYFTNAMSDLNYDSKKLPLGKLSKAMITRGFQTLKDLSALIDDPSLAASQYLTTVNDACEQLSNLYFTVIPHNFGRNRPPVIQLQSELKKEIELLESLGDMKAAELLMKGDRKEDLNEIDRQFRGLCLNEMTPLNQKSQEFSQLSNYLMNTRGHTHNARFQIQQIFRIERDGEFNRFDASHKTLRDRRLLWHGSRCTNFGGILSQGLRIAPPEAPVSGYMFGKGIYLADMSSKSANYCCSYISHGQALLLLCEAELGDPLQELTQSSYNADETAKQNNMLSTWGQGSTGPNLWKDAECVHPSLKGVKMPDTTVTPGPTNIPNAYLQYNEYICYDVSQVRLRYLFRIKM
ncbi:poly polymerase catalytic domain-containing protein [Xylaria bambusicola]|uniref:poly polymerase catalytic domain-containing protein n=1 Tax=Xylaria bambusicola TaxID=326684 RepID=UPI002008CBF2|nr:poly polymerase catalytic domain-containing protein [Xylaria bambusicola]KAI0521356.1 poly polymerase catalytic domain-containing protein [Xylaria bambusicola]